jgi:hypothetical protein
MAKAIVHGVGEASDSICKGDISFSRTIRRDDVETNQPVITIEKDGVESIEIEVTWGEAMALWDTLTMFMGSEIIRERVDDALNNRKRCHYCGARYEEAD